MAVLQVVVALHSVKHALKSPDPVRNKPPAQSLMKANRRVVPYSAKFSRAI